MKGKFTHIESKGLPGGPNEMFTYTTGVFSVKGYKRDSPDVDNPFNIIPSGNITMKDVDFPVLGTDNLGNSKVMMPGNDYKFPGDMVFETPMAQFGGMTRRKVDKVLDQNKNLNFVQRMYQENTPSMIIPGQDAPSTHFMESADNIVYPTVVQMPDGTLQYLGDDAYNYAVESGEYIEFPNPRQARRFGKSYKKGTGVLKQKDGAQRGKEITPYESWENAKAVYDPVYNKVAKAYGYDPESSSTLEKLLNDERIDKYVRSGIEEAYGYSIDDFEFGRRRVPPLEGGIKDFQKLILNASDEELRNLLKKDYSDIGLTNFKSYLPEQLSYWDALKYMKKFYDYINDGYTFQEGGGVARESTAVNRPMMLPDNFDPGPVVPPTVAEVKGLKPTSSGTIRASEAPSTAKKVMNRAANPMSAFKYFATGEQAPEMIPDKEVPLDYAMDVINPFAWLDYATKAGRDIREGDYVGATFNALGATPVIPATAKPMSRIIKNAPSRVNPNYFKPNEDLWYRQVGKSAIDDISKSKMIRERGEDIAQSRAQYDEAVMKMKGIDPATGKEYTDHATKYQQMTLGARKPPSPYFSKGELFWGMDRRPGMKGLKGRGLDADSRYLIESKLSDEAFHPAYVKGLKTDYTGEKLFGTTAILKPMPEFRNPADFNLYRRNWWSGYKPIRQKGGETVIPSWLNPMNWGVKDYSEETDFNKAFSSAKRAGEKEFMWNGKRYNTITKNLPGERIRERDDFQGTIFTKPEPVKDTSRHGDLFNYYKGQPLISNTHNLQVSKFRPDDETDPNSKYISIQNDAFKDAIIYYGNNYYTETGKANRPSYTTPPSGGWDINLRPFSDLGNFKLKKLKDDRGEYFQYYDIWDYGRNNNPNLNKPDNLGQTKPFEIYDRIYVKDYGDGQYERMYYSDKELSELDINKKNFDTLALQRELSNRGYKFPNSTKEDGSFDGILGDETKQALLDWQSKNKKQEGGETDPKFLQNEVVERFATGDKLPYKPGKGPTRPNKYTVQPGDTLYGIARKKDTSVKDLESWNKDLEPNNLKAGQIINLPTGSPDVPMGITSELLRRQAFKESSFNPNAISKSGYKGLGQIGDAVISDYLKRNNLEGEIDPFDPKQNSDVQKWYMDQLYNAAFIKKGNPSDKVRVAKALAAYNAGPGTLLEVLEDQKKKGVDIYNSLDWLQGMPKEETRGYIKAILLGEDEKFEKWYDDAKKNPENKKYLDLFNKAQDGAEITLMDLYKGYIYDQFTDKAMQQKAKNAYDKLNRVYYRDAKAAGMSVPNYIMTNMNKL